MLQMPDFLSFLDLFALPSFFLPWQTEMTEVTPDPISACPFVEEGARSATANMVSRRASTYKLPCVRRGPIGLHGRLAHVVRPGGRQLEVVRHVPRVVVGAYANAGIPRPGFQCVAQWLQAGMDAIRRQGTSQWKPPDGRSHSREDCLGALYPDVPFRVAVVRIWPTLWGTPCASTHRGRYRITGRSEASTMFTVATIVLRRLEAVGDVS